VRRSRTSTRSAVAARRAPGNIAHARQHKYLRSPGEDLSRRDLVIEAQYEVLGNEAKRHGRPIRDDRNAWILVSHATQGFQHWSIVPSGTDGSLKTLAPELRAGLLSSDFFAKPRCILRGEQRKTERSSNA